MRRKMKKIAALVLAFSMAVSSDLPPLMSVKADTTEESQELQPSLMKQNEVHYTVAGGFGTSPWSPLSKASEMQPVEGMNGVYSFETEIPAYDKNQEWLNQFSICRIDNTVFEGWDGKMCLGTTEAGDSQSQIRIISKTEGKITVYFDSNTGAVVVRDEAGEWIELLISWVGYDGEALYMSPEDIINNPIDIWPKNPLKVDTVPNIVQLNNDLKKKIINEEHSSDYRDTEKPEAVVTVTNRNSYYQNASLYLLDNEGIAGYYWGTDSNYENNTFTETGSYVVNKKISEAGTYYLTVKDTSGNISDTKSVTLYKTTFDANGGEVSTQTILTKSGMEMSLPTPNKDGCVFKGWALSADAEEGTGDVTITVNDSNTYYAIWTKFSVSYPSVIECEYGSNITLNVEAESDFLITYQWYYYDKNSFTYVEIEGATEKSLSVKADENTYQNYKCVVDDGHNKKEAVIDVKVDTGLNIKYAEKADFKYGADGELKVNATGLKEIEYQWGYANDYWEANSGVTTMIEGETTDTLALKADENTHGFYVCTVSDGINTQKAVFEVHVDTGFKVENESEVFVKYGEITELTVNASSLRPLTYTWYGADDAIIENNTNSLVISGNENTYYRCWVSDGLHSTIVNFNVKIDTGLKVSFEENVVASYGDVETLVVNATSSRPITYQWYNTEDGLMEGETNSSLSVTANEEAASAYWCEVSDGVNRETAGFTIKIDTGFILTYDDFVSAKYGMNTVLGVQAESELNISYQWYGYDSEEYIELTNATGKTLSITADENAYSKYKCVVSDGIHTEEAIISLVVDTELRLSFEEEVDVRFGEEVTLSVGASGFRQLSYQWYGLGKNGWVKIMGETKGNLSVTADENAKTLYKCVISDGVNEKKAVIQLNIDTGFDINYTEEVSTKYGNTVELKVNASSELPISYEWYGFYADEIDGYYRIIDGKTSDTLSITADEKACSKYRCIVTDGINTKDVFIKLNIDTEISISYEDAHTLQYGETKELKVDASSLNPVTYQWYYTDSDGEYPYYEKMFGETKNVLSVKAVEDIHKKYKCIVSDGVNTKEAIISVMVDTKFSINYETEIVADYGASVQLNVNAASTVPVKYQWYYFDSKDNLYYIIGGEKESSLTVAADATAYPKYKCVVSDGFNTEEAIITVNVDTGFTMSYEEEVQLEYGKTSQLKVEAKSSEPVVTYQWYYESENLGYVKIKDENNASLPIVADKTAHSKYKCVVSDGVNTKEAIISVTIDTGLSVTNDEIVKAKSVGDMTELTVNATSASDSITYQWYQWTTYYDSEYGVNYERYVKVDDASTNSLVVKAGDGDQYKCIVSDGINSKEVFFQVKIDQEHEPDILYSELEVDKKIVETGSYATRKYRIRLSASGKYDISFKNLNAGATVTLEQGENKDSKEIIEDKTIQYELDSQKEYLLTVSSVNKDVNLIYDILLTKHKEEETTPEETTPEATTPEVTTPEATTPEETTPEVTTPEVTTPEATTPEETTPQEPTKQKETTTPEETSTEEPTKQKETTTTQETTKQQETTTPEETTTPQETSTEEPTTKQEETTSKEPETNKPAAKKSQTLKVAKSYTKEYGAKPFKLSVKLTKGNGKLSYISSNKNVASVDKNGKVTIKGTGICTITVKASSTSTYKSAAASIIITVTPKKNTISKVTAVGGKTLNVTWKKDTKGSGYELQCSTSKSFSKKNTVTVSTKNNKIVSYEVKKLIKGKQYYVRVRTFRNVKVNGKTKKLYGSWSSVKKSGKVK